MGALLTAFDSLSVATLPLLVRHNFFQLVRSVAGVEPSSEEVLECKDRLCETYFQKTDSVHEDRQPLGIFSNVGRLSPDCVADVVTSDHPHPKSTERRRNSMY